MDRYTINVRCTEESSGKTGTFISRLENRTAISPVFDSLAELYPWMRQNKWVSDSATPWGCKPVETKG